MFVWIPGELISLITFPGVIIHEIAHRFFCDIFKVPVYEINYFRPGDKTAGHVRHANIDSFWISFLIGIAPFFINSVLCMILTFPRGIVFYLGTSDLPSSSASLGFLGFVLYWAGGSIGFNAIPSTKDLEGLWNKTESYESKALLILVNILFWPFNINMIGPMFSVVYAYLLSMLLPAILF